MFNNRLSKYKKALLLGTGGGNDIVSATLIADYLIAQGISCDVAGVLSPGAVHTFDGYYELAVNEITNTSVRRYINRPINKLEISFIDSVLPETARNAGYKVGKFFELSTKFGTENLVTETNKLIEREEYDVFIEVDVGGDILGRRCDKTILSPLMDFTSLYLLDKVSVDSYLIEFGLGTDGELRPLGIQEIFQELVAKNAYLCDDDIDIADPEIDRFKRVLETINKVRIGHTATMTLETLANKGKSDIHSQYYSTWKVGGKTWKNYYDVTLPVSSFGKVYLFDGRILPSLRTDTAISYETPLEQFIKLKKTKEWKTELDMCYIDNGTVLCLTPSLQVPEDMRIEIIKHGLDYQFNTLRLGQVIMLRNDAHLCGKYHVRYCKDFIIVADSELKFIIDEEECSSFDVLYAQITNYEK